MLKQLFVQSNGCELVALCAADRRRRIPVGLSERVRTRVEEFGRVELRDDEAVALVWSKAVHLHVVLLVVAVPVVVWSGTSQIGGAVFFISFPAFWLGGVAEAVATPGAGAAEKAKGVGKATGAFVLGVVGFVTLVGVVGH